jgi:hypothetical protein
MTTNTKPNSGVNPNAPVATPASSEGAGKSTIKMGSAYNALSALHALAASYRGLIDLLKELRMTQIDELKDFTNQAWSKAYDAAKDSKHALFMQAGASLVGGGLSIAGAAANGLTSGTEKANQTQAARDQTFLKDLKSKMQNQDVTLVGQAGLQAGGGNLVTATDGTKAALTLLKEGNYDELRNRLSTNTITPADLTDAAKFARVGADNANHVDIIRSLDDGISKWTNKELIASNAITQQQNLNKSMVDLAQGIQQGGFNIQQAKDTEKARQEEADATKTSQAQKMADQSQSDFGGSLQETARDLRSISEQIGRIVPQRG